MRRLVPLALALPLFAQTPAAHFDVASIRPSQPAAHGTDSADLPGRYTATNRSLLDLIREAWNVRDYQISGPDWLTTERFDVVANFPAGATERQLEAMKQTLLLDRFGLKLHTETRNLPVYGLVIAKSGVRFQPAKPDAPSRNLMNGGRGSYDMRATRKTMADLAEALSRFADRPVRDMTGLTGTYDFTLQWMREEAQSAATEVGLKLLPTMSVAMEEQLGLRLEPRSAPIEMLVIDRAQKTPTGN
jgi:uncharacterized protein (TIGR03435 family)